KALEGGARDSAWLARIADWRKVLPNDRPGAAPDGAGYVDAYDLVEKLSEVVPGNETMVVDTGGNLTWTCNGFRIQPGQRLISDWNNTAMGYALPAAIGVAFRTQGSVTCIIGDGGLMLCLGELAMLARHKLPV